MKNIVFGYSLPSSLVNKIGLSRFRVYASAQNLFTITKYSGFDPEVSTFSSGNSFQGSSNTTANAAPGTDFLTFPQSRTVTVGVNLTFK
jgi:hypothetical protein